MPVVGTKAAASSQGFGEFAQAGTTTTYIEDVFSTYLYTGNGSTQTITNGIDLAGKGGLTWIKQRSISQYHALIDTARGNNSLSSNVTAGQAALGTLFSGFTSSGFTLGPDNGSNFLNGTDITYASWTFRKQPKFFDVVTYTGNGTSQTINHNLGSTPGFIICKSTTSARNWLVYHKSLGATQFLQLDTTIAATTASTPWNNTAPTSTTFTVGSSLAGNENGQTFVAYLFADNAGGFGLTGTDNVISCGSYTGNGSASGPTVTLGYEPQWVLIKKATGTADNWILFDNMRGMPVGAASDFWLFPNSSAAEATGNTFIAPTATGFYLESSNSMVNQSSQTYIYIAIRRGPMKTPTSGTSVFSLQAYADASLGSSNPTLLGASTGFPVDLVMGAQRNQDYSKIYFSDRLRGAATGLNNTLASATTNAEGTYDSLKGFDTQQGAYTAYNNAWYYYSDLGRTFINYYLRRAPGFFDEVCYTVSGSSPINHNLGVAPELVIYKTRGSVDSWYVCANTNGFGSLNSSGAWGGLGNGNGLTNIAQVTSTTISNSNGFFYTSGQTIVAYLFASCPGVSKVGTYSGTGATQTISCGFAARFVMIKRTDSTGDWFVWDTARGMVAGTDPRLALNSTAAETNANWVYTDASGFQIVTTDATVNASGGSYIFLAVS